MFLCLVVCLVVCLESTSFQNSPWLCFRCTSLTVPISSPAYFPSLPSSYHVSSSPPLFFHPDLPLSLSGAFLSLPILSSHCPYISLSSSSLLPVLSFFILSPSFPVVPPLLPLSFLLSIHLQLLMNRLSDCVTLASAQVVSISACSIFSPPFLLLTMCPLSFWNVSVKPFNATILTLNSCSCFFLSGSAPTVLSASCRTLAFLFGPSDSVTDVASDSSSSVASSPINWLKIFSSFSSLRASVCVASSSGIGSLPCC